MLQYKYSPLPAGPSIIRVLRLLPNEDSTIPIKCQLISYSLPTTGKGHHLYEALSYVWGSESKPQCIFIDGCALPVTDNLYTALLHLRDYQLPRILWVDAVCINQQDDQEKASQIQLMPIIYGQASHVIVWLGAAADNSDRALENIRLSAEYKPSEDKATIMQEKKTDYTAILMLLQRPWFRRIWVLQEVSAARSILVMCGSIKMNGYTFSSGLKGLNLLYKIDPGLESLIRSITYLIRGAIFRPEYMTYPRGTLSLGELIDMYHTREATKKHDKVYALLGMSSDVPKEAGLLPNYELPWNILFHRVIVSILPEIHSVETWPNKEIAVIKVRGYILGRINSVEGDSSRYDRQCVQISFNTAPRSLSYESEWGTQWTLQASAKSIQEGDIVCLFQGASEPSIIGMCEDYFTIKMISATPQQNKEEGNVDQRSQKSLYTKESILRDILLIWNWEISRANSEKEDKSEIPIKFKDAAPDSEIDLDNKELSDFALIIEDIIMIAMKSGSNGNQMMERLLDKSGSKLPVSETVVKMVAGNAEWGGQIMELLLQQRGESLPISEEVVKIAAGNPVCGAEVIELLLQHRGESLPISEEIVKIAAENPTMKLLLQHRGESLPVSEEVVEIAAGNAEWGGWIIELLLQLRGESLPISEEVVKIAAGNTEWGGWIMKLLLQLRGESLRIPVEVVKIAAGNPRWGELLLQQRGESLPISEEVVKIAAGNAEWGDQIMELLLQHRGKSLPISEELVKIAAGSAAWRGESLPITEEVVEIAAGNSRWGYQIMELLLRHRCESLPISEEVAKIAAGNAEWGYQIMELLLQHRGESLPISEEVVEIAAGNSRWGYQIMELLLQHRGESLPISEEVVNVTAGNTGRGGESLPISEEVVKIAAGNAEWGGQIIKLLLRQKRDSPPISEEVVKVATRNSGRVYFLQHCLMWYKLLVTVLEYSVDRIIVDSVDHDLYDEAVLVRSARSLRSLDF
ncbi:HET domain-containing protein [Aspergillus alliaceus]|uniref:HET domain-containing protein n=1 Tax=Petromyces alliaceus TaxID=209559 RepID=UPI0012A61C4F|nr:heterokaryon incompatibility protein-domain-containing protein [Aspergillus alliaceus]KAB8228791.1 heterokaryon incompatibility protein-domain-containing protein [Aspergillus alliaceus]